MIILTFTRCSNHSALNFKFTAEVLVTIYHLSFATVRGELLLKMILEVCLFKNVHEIKQQYKQKLITCLKGLFKLFVACSSWRILKHRLNHIFHCHLLRIFESFEHTSKIPTSTLLIKTNTQIHFKMLSCNFYFLKNLTNYRNIILHSTREFKISLLERVLQIKHFLPFKHFFLA